MSQNKTDPEKLTLALLHQNFKLQQRRKLPFLDLFFPAELLYAQTDSDPKPKTSGTKTAEHSSPAQQKRSKPKYTKPFIPYRLAKDKSHLQAELDAYYQVLFGNKSTKGDYPDAINGLHERIANAIANNERVIPQIREHMKQKLESSDRTFPETGKVVRSLRNVGMESSGLQERFHSLLKEIEQEEAILCWLDSDAGSVPLDEMKKGLDSRAGSFAWLDDDTLNTIKSAMNTKSFVDAAASQFNNHMHADEENAFLWLLLGALLQDWIDVVVEHYDASFRRLEPAPGHALPDEITMCSEDPRLKPDRFVPDSYLQDQYIPRENRMADLENGLQHDPHKDCRAVVLLSGQGGSGKTELARMYAGLSDKYKSVLWLTYSKEYRSAGEGKALGQLLKDCAYADVSSQLPMWEADRLIVIDNLDVQDNVLMRDLLTSDLTGSAPILITTRDKNMFQDSGSKYLKDYAAFSSICLNDDLKEQAETAAAVFQSCCPQDCKDEKLLIPEICARLDNNLLLVSYLAKNTKSTPSQILSDLNRLPVLNPAGALRNLGRVSHHYQTVDQPETLIRYVFGDLLDNRRFADQPLQAQALALLALLPGAAVDRNLAAALLGDGEGTLAAEALSALEKADLLRKSGEGQVTLHSLMAEILLSYQPAVQALMKDAAFWGQILENRLTMKHDSGATPALIYAVLAHIYTLGETACAAQRLALLIEQGNPDELFRKLHPVVRGTILACAEHRTERRFVWWDLQKRQEETILSAQHRYYLDGAAAEPLSGGQHAARYLHLYFALYPDASLPLHIPDRLGGKPVTEIPAQFCTKADPEMFKHIADRYQAGKTAFFSSLQLPRWLTTIGDDAFASLWVSQQTLQLPSTLREIGDRAFAGCEFTGLLELPKSLTHIGSRAFAENLFYGDLRLPEKLSSLGDGAFENSGSFGSLSAGGSIQILPKKVFAYTSFSGKIQLPENLQEIGDYAFNSVDYRGKLTLPAALHTIGEGAFEGCSHLQGTLNLLSLEHLEKIGPRAFFVCDKLEMPSPDEITKLKAKGVTIGEWAFAQNGAALQENETAIRTGISPKKLSALRKLADHALQFQQKLEQSLEQLRARCLMPAFDGKIEIPDGLERIPAGAFQGLTKLREVQLPPSVTRIDERAFQGCIALKTINLDAVMDIRREAFQGCAALNVPMLPPKLRYLSPLAFADCISLSGPFLPRKFVSFAPSAFRNCPNLKLPPELREEITAPVICEENGETVIRFDDSLHDLRRENLPDMLEGRLELPDCCLTAIRSLALSKQKGVTGDLTIPASVLRIEMFAFAECGLDGTVVIKGRPVIEMGAFSFTNIKKLIFEQDAQEIGHAVFESCKHLTIYAPPDSTAARYALANGIPFVPLT